MNDDNPSDIMVLENQVYNYPDFPEIIVYRQIFYPTNSTHKVLISKLVELGMDKSKYNYFILIADYTENIKRETAEMRSYAIEHIKAINFKHMYFVTGKNSILNTAIKFAIRASNIKSYSVHKTFDDALSHYKSHFLSKN